MFTIEQIKAAHAKVKSGADYPLFVQQLIKMGVTGYSTFIEDGHTEYAGLSGYRLQTPAGPVQRTVSSTSNTGTFKSLLLAHQRGETDYPTFCNEAAATGVEKWVVDMHSMTCTYYDKAGRMMVEEKIPG